MAAAAAKKLLCTARLAGRQAGQRSRDRSCKGVSPERRSRGGWMEAGEVHVGGLKRQPAGNRPPLARSPRPPAVCAPRPSCRPQPRPAVWLAGGLADTDDSYIRALMAGLAVRALVQSLADSYAADGGAQGRARPRAASSSELTSGSRTRRSREGKEDDACRPRAQSPGVNRRWLTTGNNFRDHSQHIRRCLVCLGKRLTHAKKGDGGRQRKRGNCHRQSGTRWTARCTGDGRARLWLGRRQKGWRS
jgi:hypothetical protein